MTDEFRFDSVGDVAVGVASGTLSLSDAKQFALAMWSRVGGNGVRVLWDLREARFDLDPDQVRELAAFTRTSSPQVGLRTAFVVTQDLEFGLVRMFEVFRESENARTAVFRDKEEALSWLTGGED